MCLIIAKNKKIELPSDDIIKAADNSNSDGIGIAYWKNGANEVHIKKTFENVEEFIPWVKENIRLEDVCIMHFRIATQGLKDKGNRHPFPIAPLNDEIRQIEINCPIAIAHNGVMKNSVYNSKYSDTQQFIAEILNDATIKENLRTDVVHKLIANYIGSYNKLAILYDNGDIDLYGNFTEDKGLFYSNTHYKYTYAQYSHWGHRSYWYQNDKSAKETTTPNSSNELDTCDYCFTKTKCRWFSLKGIKFLLCKKCRKKVKRGHIFLSSFNGNFSLRPVIQQNKIYVECSECSTYIEEKEKKILKNKCVCETCFNLTKN